MNLKQRFMLALAAVAFATGPAQANDYPSKQINVIIPFTPGGSNDVLGRVLGKALEQRLKVSVVAENKAGAAGNIGAAYVARAEPDGYTLLITPSSITTMNPNLYKSLSFDPLQDFSSVSLLGTVPMVLVVHPDLPVKSVKELIAYCKENPGKLSFGSSGIGSPQQLSAEIFKSMAGVEMENVPYRGAAPAIADLLAGRVQVLFGPINSILPHINAGKLRALGITGKKGTALLPGVPTIAEAGLPGYDFTIWAGLDAPSKTPKTVIDKLNSELVTILAQPEIKATLAAQGIEAESSTPAELKELTLSDYARWKKLIDELEIPKQ